MNQSEQVLRCTVCKKPKHSLRPRKSKLVNTIPTMMLCDDCFSGKKEPRWAIIMTARLEGADAVTDWVKNHRYVGEPIMLSELIG